MQIHQLPSIRKRAQRIGRGGKRGSYSGRGVKGQKSRAGRRLRPAERDLILRLPKRRGFANPPKKEKHIIFSVGDLSARLTSFVRGKDPLLVNTELLKAAGMVRKSFRGSVKLLGGGEAAFPMQVKGIAASALAKMKIEKTGGSLEN